MPSKKPFTDLEFRETLWYLAEEVDQKLEAVKTILSDFCDYYGTETCQDGVCDIDPNGWEGCLTRQILEILEGS